MWGFEGLFFVGVFFENIFGYFCEDSYFSKILGIAISFIWAGLVVVTVF